MGWKSPRISPAGNLGQVVAGVAQALGPVATCIIVIVPCAAIVGCVWLISRVVNQIVAKATVARFKGGEMELLFQEADAEK